MKWTRKAILGFAYCHSLDCLYQRLDGSGGMLEDSGGMLGRSRRRVLMDGAGLLASLQRLTPARDTRSVPKSAGQG